MNKITRLSTPKAFTVAAISFCLAAVQGCVFTAINATTPSDGYAKVQTIAYGTNPRQTFDYYTPTTPIAATVTLVFFYGGAWEDGKKEDYRFVAQAFSEQGYAIAIPDYRTYPEVLFPDFIKDSAAALAKLKQHQPDNTFILIGHSAGAHIAALLALDESYLTAEGLSRADINAWIGWSGPYDFLPLTGKTLQKIFSGAENLADTQPINFVSDKAPPALLIQGLDDSTVIPRNTERLTAALQKVSVPVQTIYYDGVGHVGTVAAVAPLLRKWSNSLDDTLRFIESRHGDTP